jgi:hypothetical protein
MKKAIKVFVFLFTFTGLIAITLFADPPETPNPPNPGGSPVGNGDPVGAPLDGGLSFLLILGGAYGARKIYSIKKL